MHMYSYNCVLLQVLILKPLAYPRTARVISEDWIAWTFFCNSDCEHFLAKKNLPFGRVTIQWSNPKSLVVLLLRIKYIGSQSAVQT
jgi:hypothetical protein